MADSSPISGTCRDPAFNYGRCDRKPKVVIKKTTIITTIYRRKKKVIINSYCSGEEDTQTNTYNWLFYDQIKTPITIRWNLSYTFTNTGESTCTYGNGNTDPENAMTIHNNKVAEASSKALKDGLQDPNPEITHPSTCQTRCGRIINPGAIETKSINESYEIMSVTRCTGSCICGSNNIQ